MIMERLYAIRNTQYAILVLVGSFLLSGCVVRSYPLTKERVDQGLTGGNRGYIMGSAPASEETKKKTRTTQAVEIELRSPIKFERMPKERPIKRSVSQASSELAIEGNRGFLTQSVTPETAELKVAEKTNFEKYTVQKNDTLQKISQKFYGTSKKWAKIYEANKDTLKGPNKIYPGQVINIPLESMKEAKENIK